LRRSRKPPSLPSRFGISPHSVFVPAGEWPTLSAFLAYQFPSISEQRWQQRLAQGLVLDQSGKALEPDAICPVNVRIFYYRELEREIPVPFEERVLFEDENILVADKPHFLPTLPVGQYLQETLMTRLRRRLNNDELVALHRLDRDTAGLVLVAKHTRARDAYHALFRERRIHKVYRAVAPVSGEQTFPLTRSSRIGPAQEFYRRQEMPGPVNAVTEVDLLHEQAGKGLFQLQPVTGKTHQLRIHMAALGMPILNDNWYPSETARAADDFTRPLQLLAHTLVFVDPFSGKECRFQSRQVLAESPAD